MIVAPRRRPFAYSSQISAGTPYAEQADRRENRLDGALLNAWGHASAYLFSGPRYRQFERFVQRVEDREAQLTVLSDEGLRRTADELRGRLLPASPSGDEIALAFALAREAARRHTQMRHFRVQLLGGAAMMAAAVAEMQTGEGKSLTALLPAVAAAFMGRPVHIVTVNDYLARRDAEQFRSTFNALGLSVGLVEHGQQHEERQRAYACDVTYCTNKELVFDYLRDRLALGARRARTRLLVDEVFKARAAAGQPPSLLLRGLHFAIVDEADSVLIDEARTPLILSGMHGEDEVNAGIYQTALDFARRLVADVDYSLSASERTMRLTVQGERRVAELAAGLPGLWAIRRARDELVQQALTALGRARHDVRRPRTGRGFRFL
jgi:preprotein translocase subunit SecA